MVLGTKRTGRMLRWSSSSDYERNGPSVKRELPQLPYTSSLERLTTDLYRYVLLNTDLSEESGPARTPQIGPATRSTLIRLHNDTLERFSNV